MKMINKLYLDLVRTSSPSNENIKRTPKSSKTIPFNMKYKKKKYILSVVSLYLSLAPFSLPLLPPPHSV
jgi:hypothetical protein